MPSKIGLMENDMCTFYKQKNTEERDTESNAGLMLYI